MKVFPAYEFFFALASWVTLLSFGFFARRRPRLWGERFSLRRLAIFCSLAAICVFAGAWGLAKLQGVDNGMAFYGGLGLFLIFAWGFSGCRAREFFELLDRAAPGIALGHAVGRIGCFFDGCCYGTHCDLPWAVHNAVARDSVHPVQLYESFSLFVLGFLLWKNELRRLEGKDSFSTAGEYLCAYAVLRFALEFFRGDETRGMWGPLSTSQWIAIPIFGVGLLGALRTQRCPLARS